MAKVTETVENAVNETVEEIKAEEPKKAKKTRKPMSKKTKKFIVGIGVVVGSAALIGLLVWLVSQGKVKEAKVLADEAGVIAKAVV